MVMEDNESVLQMLLQRSFDGDQSAYHEVLKQLRKLLRTYVRRQLMRVGRADFESEDIVQDALLAIHTKWHTYDRNLPLTAWVHAIARYKLIDFLRSSTNRARDVSLDELEDTIDSDGRAVDTALTLSSLVAALPANLRQSVELVKLKGLSIKEASVATGLSEGSVKVNVHRGVKKLAQRFWRNTA